MEYGVLQIKDGTLCDEHGNAVQLRGMSTHGLQWKSGSWVLTDDAFDVLVNDWQCKIIRLAMYVTEEGYRDNPGLNLKRLEQGIELCTKRGLYAIVDWHVHQPGDPNDELYATAGLNDPDMPPEFLALKNQNPEWTGAQVFFAYIAQKYGHQGNILYEPANEPSGNGKREDRFEVWSRVLKPYYDAVISVIRQFDKKGIIICGTDNWSQYVDSPITDPIKDPNVIYALHFYAGTHDTADESEAGIGVKGKNKLRAMTDNALKHGLAVMATEWGVSTATGDGGPYFELAMRWLKYMSDRNISWCAWSMAKHTEISAAFFKTTSEKPKGAWQGDEVSVAGKFYRAMIRGDELPEELKNIEPEEE